MTAHETRHRSITAPGLPSWRVLPAAVVLLGACTTPRLLPHDASVPMDAARPDAAADAAIAEDAPLDAPPDAWMCVTATNGCTTASQCCGALVCESTATSGPERTVCCGQPTEPCTFTDAEDCCGRLVCRVTASSPDVEVCCAETGQPCTTSTGCCGSSVCRSGVCS